MKKKKVCILWHCPYPWDIRIEKFCRTFLSANFEVSIICRGKNESSAFETVSNVDVYRIFPPPWLNKRVLTAPLFFNPVWVRNARRLLGRIRPDLLIVRDIPMGLLAGKLAREIDIPVVLDMAENYPAALLDFKNKLTNPWLFPNAFLPRVYEKLCARQMTHILVVADEQRERLIREGMDPAKMSLVMNTPDLKFYCELEEKVNMELPELPEGKRLIYVGFLEGHRSVDVLIKAVSASAKASPGLSLLVIGSGPTLDYLRTLTQDLHAGEFIKLLGWVPFEQVPFLIKGSDIGVIPHMKSEHTDTTIPNKLFDYMAFGKPVITSNILPVERIVRESNCGSVFESRNVNDLSEKILDMAAKKDMDLLGKNGMEAVRKKYNWDNDSRILLNAISETLLKFKK